MTKQPILYHCRLLYSHCMLQHVFSIFLLRERIQKIHGFQLFLQPSTKLYGESM